LSFKNPATLAATLSSIRTYAKDVLILGDALCGKACLAILWNQNNMLTEDTRLMNSFVNKFPLLAV